jgi:hypothetical protein
MHILYKYCGPYSEAWIHFAQRSRGYERKDAHITESAPLVSDASQNWRNMPRQISSGKNLIIGRIPCLAEPVLAILAGQIPFII